MALKWFTYPLAETRFLHAGRSVYKFKMRYSSHIREGLGVDRKQIQVELEGAIRAVLGNLDALQPFATVHFNIFPYKSEWERLSELRFKQGDKTLISYPYVCMLYVEPRSPDPHRFYPGSMKDPVERPAAKGGATTGAERTKKRKGEEAPDQPRKRFRKSGKENTAPANTNTATGGRWSERQLQPAWDVSSQRAHALSAKPADATPGWRKGGAKERGTSQRASTPNSPEAATGGILQFFSSAFPFRLIFGSRRPL
uniref:Uncharacterized protein n=1 Tax=Callorhinchus milii TaxID=7868 RepID=V9KZR2_CALMI